MNTQFRIMIALASFAALPAFGGGGTICAPEYITLFPDGQTSTIDTAFGGVLCTHDDLVFILAVGDSGRSVILYDSNGWNELRRFVPDDLTPPTNFGREIIAEGDSVLISADDAVYLFDIDTGTQLRKIVQPISATTEGFGSAIAMTNDRVFVGATRYSTTPWASLPHGAVYVFDRATGAEIDTLTIESDSTWDGFGSKIRIDDGYLYVNAINNNFYLPNNPIPDPNRGTISIFDLQTFDHLETFGSNISNLNGGTHHFGSNFVVHNGQIPSRAVAPGCQDGALSMDVLEFAVQSSAEGRLINYASCYGDAFLCKSMDIDAYGMTALSYTETDETFNEIYHWVALHNLAAPDPSQIAGIFSVPPTFDGSGQPIDSISVGLTDTYVLAGLPDAADSEGYGRVLVFFRNDCTLAFFRADLNNDNALDIFDVFAYLDLYSSNDNDADLDCNGEWDIFDVFTYLDYYEDACDEQ